MLINFTGSTGGNMAGEIFEAIQKRDLARVAQLVTENPAVARERNPAGVSAIMQARYYGQQSIIDLLRAHAGDLDVFEASALGDMAQLKKLLKANPELTRSYSPDGFTPLHLAAYFGQLESAGELLRQGADPVALANNGTKLAVINSAAASGSTQMVKLILHAGANPNVQQEGGYTALHSAAHRNNVEMICALLDAGADISIRTKDGKTAAEMANPEVAAMLAQA
jgi:ankyrin repeat protein